MQNTRNKLKDDVYSDNAINLSRLSKDKNTQVGAVIVASDGTPVSWGYNGTVSGFPDDIIPHSRDLVKLHYIENINDNISHIEFETNKYPFMAHAESNAIFFADRQKLVGSTIYVTGFPCVHCALEIARANISRVVVKNKECIDSNSMLNNQSNEAKMIFAKKGILVTVDGVDILLS